MIGEQLIPAQKAHPGPWFVDDLGGIRSAEGHWLADCDMNGNTLDLRLMAAAPELLAALQDCMADADAYEQRTGKKLVGGWPEKARAAIAKATGVKA